MKDWMDYWTILVYDHIRALSKVGGNARDLGV